MPRYQLTIEYDGTDFVGWQAQENGPSIQAAIKDAVKKFCQQDVNVNGAGRTDAGVHAYGQVAHIDLSKDWPTDTVQDALNAHLRPLPIAVVNVNTVSPEFDARFSAVERSYTYQILNRRAQATLLKSQVWTVFVPLSASHMHDAAQSLIGTHDFTTFRATECQAKSPVRTLDLIDVSRDGDMIYIDVTARSFLHNQVRSIVGSLKLVGEGKWTQQTLIDALAAKDRKACGPVAPASGLYLTHVSYDEQGNTHEEQNSANDEQDNTHKEQGYS